MPTITVVPLITARVSFAQKVASPESALADD